MDKLNIMLDPNDEMKRMLDEKGLSSFNKRENKTVELMQLFTKPIENEEDSVEEKVEAIYEKLKNDFISDRLLYSTISNMIYGMENIELDDLQSTCELLVNYSEEQGDHNVLKIVGKLIDHINLALAQERFVMRNNREAIEESQSMVQDYLDDTQELKGRIENLTTQLISILGIFTAISFVVFGGISSASNILSNINKISLPKLIVLASIWGIAIVNLVFFLIYFIAKLSRISIKTNQRYNASLVRRHPYICIINFVLSSILLVGLWLSFVETAVGNSWIKSLVTNNKDLLLFGTLFIFIIILLLFIWLIFKLKDDSNEIGY